MKNEHNKTIKCQRLCVDEELTKGAQLSLGLAQFHYLKNVLRMPEGAAVRVFNGRDGEWLSFLSYTGKKEAALCLQECLRAQPEISRRICLAFAPIKKARMDFLVEKAVELGAHELQPVLTQNTEVRTIRDDRLDQQIKEAAEQCERLDLPVLKPLLKMDAFLTTYKDIPVLACLERTDADLLKNVAGGLDRDFAVLIGPEGGFSKEEASLLQKQDNVVPVSLGPHILRSETAALAALSLVM